MKSSSSSGFVTSPAEIPATGRLIGTPASISASVEPQTLPCEVEPLDIRTSTQTPALEQLRARINDTNPLRLTGGNPDLKQIYTLDAAFNYSTLPGKKGNFFQVALNFSTKFNDIVYRTDYFDSQTVLPQYDGYTVNPGTMLTTYVNESGTINASGFVTYVWSIPKTRSRIQFTLRDNYTRRPHYDGNVLNMLQSNISGGQIDLSWRKWKNVFFSLPVKADYVNSVSLGGRTESMKISISPYVNANFAKYMFASVRYNFSSDFFLNRDYPDNFDHILSAEIGCRLLNRRITMSISCRFYRASAMRMRAKSSSWKNWSPTARSVPCFWRSFKVKAVLCRFPTNICVPCARFATGTTCF